METKAKKVHEKILTEKNGKDSLSSQISKHNNKKDYSFLLFNDVLMYGTDKKIHAYFVLSEMATEDVKPFLSFLVQPKFRIYF